LSTRGSRACERRTCSRANGGLGAQASSEPFLLCLSDAQSANETCRGCRKRATRRSGLAFSSSGSEASSLTVSSPRCTSRTTRTFLLLVMSNSEHDRSDRTSKDEARRASERVDAPRALLASHPSFGSRSSPSSSGSATARRGLLQGVLETPVTFPSRAVRSVNEESRQGQSTMRTASLCKRALSLVVHPGFIGSPSACHQSGGFPATGPSAQRHFSSVQRWTTSRCGSGRRCLAVGCLCSHFAPRAFSLFALGSVRSHFSFFLRQVASQALLLDFG